METRADGSEARFQGGTTRGVVWFLFTLMALIFLIVDDLMLWASVVVPAALVLALIPSLRPRLPRVFDGRDLLAIGVLYVAVVAAFRVAFSVFTTDNVLGLFLTFAGGLLLGVVGPIVYQVWMRQRGLRSLGIGLHHLSQTIWIALCLAATQFFTTLWGYALPDPVDWVPLLVMSLVVGLFEAVFFRGFIQGRLEASFGAAPAVAGAALLYALYHIGYGMGIDEMWFLFALGVVYAISYRITSNILILWPLLTPMGAFFNNLQAGDIALPWASILGFADVAGAMVVTIWLAVRHVHKRALARPDPRREEMLV
jgi:membrane protease YdiL (CAAX protease family)